MRALCLGLLALAGLALWGSVLWRAPALPFAVSVQVAPPPAAPGDVPRGSPWQQTALRLASVPRMERLPLTLPPVPCPAVVHLDVTVSTPFAGVDALALGTPAQWDQWGRLCAHAGCRLTLGPLPCAREATTMIVTAIGAAFGRQGGLDVEMAHLPAPPAP